MDQIKNSERPVSGSALARTFQVSRQVIVQDIALIRAEGNDVISTNRGYIFTAPHTVSRIFKVHHTDADLENELCGIVDLGGKVINVMVNHRVYGHIEAELNISSRRQVENFMEDIRSGKSSPLKYITFGFIIYHKVEAESEEILDMIQDMLKRRGFLIEAE
mgnify:CR=1 FL=1